MEQLKCSKCKRKRNICEYLKVNRNPPICKTCKSKKKRKKKYDPLDYAWGGMRG